MKPISVGILSAAAVAGLAGSTVAYAWASSSTDAPAAVSSTRSVAKARPHAQPVRPGTQFRWAPCAAPAHLEHGVCVTDVVRTVVVPAPAAAAPAAPAAGPAAAPPAAQGVGSTGPTTSGATAGEPGEEHADEPGEDHEEHGDDDGDHAEEPDH